MSKINLHVTMWLALCLTFALVLPGASQTIPERRLKFVSKIPGIDLCSTDTHTQYLPRYAESTGDDYLKEVVLPEGRPVRMDLVDDYYTYRPEDLNYICSQSPYVVQDLLIHGSLDQDSGVNNLVLTIMSGQKALWEIHMYSCNIDTLAPLANIWSLKFLGLFACDISKNTSFGNDLAQARIRDLALVETWPKGGFREISRVQSLRGLYLEKVRVQDDLRNVASLNLIPHLTVLQLVDTDITSDSLRVIAKLDSVTELDLSANRKLWDCDFSVLGPMKSLKTLDVYNLGLTKKSSATLKALRGVKIVGKPIIYDE